MPRKLVNPDLAPELASLIEDYFVPHLTQQVAELLKMTASHNRGTVNWLRAVEGVGVLLALADDEQKALVLANLRGKPSLTVHGKVHTGKSTTDFDLIDWNLVDD